jgi:hypothetical protein
VVGAVRGLLRLGGLLGDVVPGRTLGDVKPGRTLGVAPNQCFKVVQQCTWSGNLRWWGGWLINISYVAGLGVTFVKPVSPFVLI